MIPHMCMTEFTSKKKTQMNSYIKQKQNPDIENKLIVAKRVTERGEMNEEYGINRYKLL